MDDGDRFTSEGDGTVRDRLKSPSINFPRSEEEAFQAIVHRARNALLGKLDLEFTTNSGLGTTRTEEQAAWLNQQQSLIRARIEDLLDELDLEHRTTDETH